MWIIIVHGECEDKATTFVHALVRLDCESKVQDVVGVGEGGLHGTTEGEFSEIWVDCQQNSDRLEAKYLSELVAGRQ